MAAQPKPVQTCGPGVRARACKHWRPLPDAGLGECRASHPAAPGPGSVDRDRHPAGPACSFPVTPSNLGACGDYEAGAYPVAPGTV